VRFAVARQEGLTETDVARIDDAYATSALPPRWKAAIALTDVVLGRVDAPAPAEVAALADAFTAPEVVELAVTAALCHGFSKIAIALGGAPADMPLTIVPTPAVP
jgi:alkylhydroperoxidase family enzyme